MRPPTSRRLLELLLPRRWALRDRNYVDDCWADVVDAECIDASLHVDTEAICPDCLRWITPDDYVRRNAFDLLEHEVCPPDSVRVRLG